MRFATVVSVFCIASAIGCGTVPKTSQPTPQTSSPDPVIEKATGDFDQSLEAWKTLKQNRARDYSYVTRSQSWAGFGSTTTVWISADSVVKRTYEAWKYDDENKRVVTDSWQEQGAEVGTHSPQPLTLDQMYEVCRSQVLTQDPSKNSLSFGVGSDDVMRNCSYVPNGCQDDCSSGVSIDSLSY